MKVLWVGDAAVASGFARCTHAACDALHAAGHNVAVLGINHFGDPHPYPYPIFPCRQPLDGGRDGLGVTRLGVLAERLRPDVVVLLTDAWNVPDYLEALKDLDPRPRVVGWIASDGENQPGDGLNGLDHAAAWTLWGARALVDGGYEGPSSVIPLGVDTAVYRPVDGNRFRRSALPRLPEGAFLVGAVGRNQLRKRLDLTIAYFAEWVTRDQRDDAFLYIHSAPTGEGAFNIPRLVSYHGMRGRVFHGLPDPGLGLGDEVMPYVYSAMDAYVTTTQGEGWGLPTLEAMACGVPAIVPDWSALGCWTGRAAIKVPCTATAVTGPMRGAGAYTVGGIPDKEKFIDALGRAYRTPPEEEIFRARGLDLAATLPWSAAGEAMVRLLESVAGGQEVAA